MRQPSSDRRVPVGIIAAVAAVLALAVAVPLLQNGPPRGDGVVAEGSSAFPTEGGASAPPASADPSPTTPPAAALPSVSPAASVPAGGPTVVTIDCGRIPATACATAISLARAGHDREVRGASLIVVDDTCPPDVACDRMYPFDSIVVFVTAGGDTTGWYSFHVFGLEAGTPTTAERWGGGEPPAHVIQLLRQPRPSP